MKKIIQFTILAAAVCGLAACSGNGGGSAADTETLTRDYGNMRFTVDVPKDQGYKIVERDSLSAELKEYFGDDYNLALVTDKAAFFVGKGSLFGYDNFAGWKAFCKEKYDAQTGYFNTYEELQIAGREAVKFDKWEDKSYSYRFNTDDFNGTTIGDFRIVATGGTIDEVMADETTKAILASIKVEQVPEE